MMSQWEVEQARHRRITARYYAWRALKSVPLLLPWYLGARGVLR